MLNSNARFFFGTGAPTAPKMEDLGRFLDQVSGASSEDRRIAAAALKKLADDPANKQPLVRNERVLRVLRNVLQSQRGATFIHALTAIWYLSREPKNLKQLFDSGFCGVLLKIVGNNTEGGRLRALNALGNLAMLEANCVHMFEMGVLPPLLKVVKVEQGEVRMKAMKALVNLSQHAAATPLRLALIKGGVLSQLLIVVTQDRGGAQLEAVKVLNNIAMEDEAREPLAEAGLLPLLVGLLENSQDSEKEATTSALMVLINLSHKVAVGDQIIEAGILQAVLPLLRLGPRADSPDGSADHWDTGGAEAKVLSLLTRLVQNKGTRQELIQVGVVHALRPVLLSFRSLEHNFTGSHSAITLHGLKALVIVACLAGRDEDGEDSKLLMGKCEAEERSREERGS
jgi:hypothetical protein